MPWQSANGWIWTHNSDGCSIPHSLGEECKSDYNISKGIIWIEASSSANQIVLVLKQPTYHDVQILWQVTVCTHMFLCCYLNAVCSQCPVFFNVASCIYGVMSIYGKNVDKTCFMYNCSIHQCAETGAKWMMCNTMWSNLQSMLTFASIMHVSFNCMCVRWCGEHDIKTVYTCSASKLAFEISKIWLGNYRNPFCTMVLIL